MVLRFHGIKALYCVSLTIHYNLLPAMFLNWCVSNTVIWSAASATAAITWNPSTDFLDACDPICCRKLNSSHHMEPLNWFVWCMWSDLLLQPQQLPPLGTPVLICSMWSDLLQSTQLPLHATPLFRPSPKVKKQSLKRALSIGEMWRVDFSNIRSWSAAPSPWGEQGGTLGRNKHSFFLQTVWGGTSWQYCELLL